MPGSCTYSFTSALVSKKQSQVIACRAVSLPKIALAQTHFRLDVWLRRHGSAGEGDAHLAEGGWLQPNSWNMWRQAADPDRVGKASGEAFWQRVQGLGEKPYYTPPEL